MASSPTSGPVTYQWKRVALKWFAGGAGFSLATAVLVATFVWYSSKPKLPKPWNSGALITKDPAGFSTSSDAKDLELSYFLENTTDTDYRLPPRSKIEVLMRAWDGRLSQPMPTVNLWGSVFIPAKQKGNLVISFPISGTPVQQSAKNESDYHEQLRRNLDQEFPSVKSLVLFDDANRYQINLPRWSSEPPKKTP